MQRWLIITYCFIFTIVNGITVEYYLNTFFRPFGLKATLNSLTHCSEPRSTNDFVQGLFGVKKIQSKECTYLQSATQSFTDSDAVESDLTLNSTAYQYCARVILNGREITIVDGR